MYLVNSGIESFYMLLMLCLCLHHKCSQIHRKHIEIEIFLSALCLLHSTLHLYSPKQAVSLVVTKLFLHLIIYEERKNKIIFSTLLHLILQAQIFHLRGLSRVNTDISKKLLKHLPSREPHFSHPMHSLAW